VAGPTVSSTSRGVADDIYDGNDGGEMWTNNSRFTDIGDHGKKRGQACKFGQLRHLWDADEAVSWKTRRASRNTAAPHTLDLY